MRCGRTASAAVSMTENEINREIKSRLSATIASPRTITHSRSFRRVPHAALGPGLSCRSHGGRRGVLAASPPPAYLLALRAEQPRAHAAQVARWKIVQSITACKTFSAPGPASAVWECTLDLPHSFAAGDGLRVQTNGQGASKDEASEVACLRAVAHLIRASPSQFLLRPKHWAVSPQELLAHLPGADAGHQALPVHIPARLRDAGEEATTPDADARLVALVRRCLDAHGGEFDQLTNQHRSIDQSMNQATKIDRLIVVILTPPQPPDHPQGGRIGRNLV